MRRANYSSTFHYGVIVVVDNDGPVSVTNDAEEVVPYLLSVYGNHPIVYRDTSGSWDRLVHDGSKFVGFNIIGADSEGAAIRAVRGDHIPSEGALP
jgi:hypothetical protein